MAFPEDTSENGACWKILESAIRERERVIASLRQELLCLEDLTGKAVATLSSKTVDHDRPPEFCTLSRPTCHAVLIQPPKVAAPRRVATRSASSPQLEVMPGHLMQAPQVAPQAPQEARKAAAYPKDFPQTPPNPRPLFRL